jgi:hypothetical protein
MTSRIQDYLNREKLPLFQIIFVSAILLSLTSTYLFFINDLHIAHFDSKGHLLVPRRMVDNLNLGFRQIGAFWLPLPHLLYLPLVQIDSLYFNGLAATPISMLCFVATVLVFYKLLERIFDRLCAFCGSALYLTNPNMLYLQSTPLTENLALLFTISAVYLFVRFASSQHRKFLWGTSLLSVLGILTRYENWFLFAVFCLLLLTLNLVQKRGFKNLVIDGFILVPVNAIAAGFTFWLNWWTTGHAYMDHSFKHTDFQPAQGSFIIAFFVILYTVGNLISYDWTLFALLAAVLVLRKRFRDPEFLAAMALLAPFVLYLYEYRDNHPTRIRYGLSFVPVAMFFLSYLPQRSRLSSYLFLIFAVYIALFSPFARVSSSRLLQESLRDAENLALQRDLLWYLQKNYDGELILAAMGEVAPVLYDLKFPVKRYVHEGAKPYWNDANAHPEKVVGWVLMAQDDRVWKRFHDNPEFHRHFALIGRRKFLELYRRTPYEQMNLQSHQPHAWIDKSTMPGIPGL